MNSIDEDLKLKIISGKPILLKKSNCFFYHRTLEEIIDFGLTDFLKIIQLFEFSSEELQENFEFPIDNFFYLLLNLNNQTQLSSWIEKGFYFFIGVNNLQPDLQNRILLCSYKDIENIEINLESFNEILEYIKIIYDGNNKEEQDDDSKLSEAERRMKEKFKKKKQEREKAKGSKDKINFSDLIGGFISKSPNMDFEATMKLPYYTFYFLLEKLKNTDVYDIQLRAAMAGADMKNEKMHHWLENTDDAE
jgi:hypothetical protein